MTGRYLSIADIARNVTDPDGAHERQHRDAELELKHGALTLEAEIAKHRFQQDARHHEDKLRQEERHHEDKMNALARSDGLEAERIGLIAKRDAAQVAVNREHVAVSRERIELDREQFAAKLEADRDGALIQAKTALTLAQVNHAGAVELAEIGHTNAVALSELGHRQSVALSELNHMQALGVLREQSQIVNANATTAILREGIHSSIRRGEETAKQLSGAVGAILVEKTKGRIAEKLAEQKEAHRQNEREHEKEMAELGARFNRVGFTAEELVRAGFSIKEATTIVERLTSGIGPQNEDEAAIFRKFDEWDAHVKQHG